MMLWSEISKKVSSSHVSWIMDVRAELHNFVGSDTFLKDERKPLWEMISSTKKDLHSTRWDWFVKGTCSRRALTVGKNTVSIAVIPWITSTLALVVLFSLIHSNTFLNETPSTKYESDHLNSNHIDASFRLAYNHSFGFFNDIPNVEWERYSVKRALSAQHYRYPQDHDRYTDNQSASWIFSNWDPYFTCPHVQKIGGLGGGSKWTCDIDRLQKVIARRKTNADEFWNPPISFHKEVYDTKSENGEKTHTAHCLVYSIGSNGNFIWEDAVFDSLGTECEIHVFDPDPFDRPGMAANKNIHFHQWGLGSSYSTDWMYRQSRPRMKKRAGRTKTLYSFQEIRKRLGHENSTIDLFKIDCEGCEWHTYKDWISADLRQILIETHELPTPNHEKRTVFGILPAISTSQVFDTFDSNGFVLFFKEVNTMKGNGYSSEWSFLKLSSDFSTG